MFWKSVEAIGHGARNAALQRYLGEAYDWIRPYLMPCPEFAAQIACKRTLEGDTCQYRIVQEPEPDRTYAAVCDRHCCPTRFYARGELVRYTINPQILVPTIARCLRLHPQICPIVNDAWQVGILPATAGRTPVFFTRVKFRDAMQRILEALILKGNCRFILVTPSVRYLNEPCRNLLVRLPKFHPPRKIEDFLRENFRA